MTPKELAIIAAKALDEKKGKEIAAIEIADLTTLADYFVIASGTSNTQINALCDAVEKAMKEQTEETLLRREGYRDGTWENGARGAHVQRVYEMEDQEGRLRVSIKSDWILIDPVTRKILRPSAFTAKPIGTCPKEIDCPEPHKIALPREGTEDLGTRIVRWSDLDGNGHLYSGNYGDIVWDALPEDLRDQVPREFQINYSKEATLGEELRLVGVREGETYRMEGLGPEAPCFTALCVF